MQVGDIEYDHDRGLLTKGSITVSISTGTRRAVWFLFVTNQNNVVTEGAIRREIYGEREMGEANIRVFIGLLRHGLRQLGSECRIVNWRFGNWELVVPQENKT